MFTDKSTFDDNGEFSGPSSFGGQIGRHGSRPSTGGMRTESKADEDADLLTARPATTLGGAGNLSTAEARKPVLGTCSTALPDCGC